MQFLCRFLNVLWVDVHIGRSLSTEKCRHYQLKLKNNSQHLLLLINKGNNKITELRTILQRESQNS